MLTDFYRYIQPLNARKTSGLCSPVCLGAHKARASIYQKTHSKLKICPLLLSMGPPLVSERECKIKGRGIVWEVSQFPSVFCATVRQVLQKKVLSNLVIIMLCQSPKC